MVTLPPQRLSLSKKLANDAKWAKDCIDYITSHAHRTREDELELRSLYDLYLSKINQQDFQKECNPFGIAGSLPEDEIKAYNKIYTKVHVLLGELLSRPTSFRTVAVDRNSISDKLRKKREMLIDFILGQSEMDPAQIEQYMETSYTDSREILTSKLLAYYQKRLDTAQLGLEGFRHALISGYEVYKLSYDGNEPYIEVINPLDFYYSPSDDSPRIEDAAWACHRTYHPLSYILDMFGNKLKKEQIEQLENDYTAHYRYDPNKMQYGWKDFNVNDYYSSPSSIMVEKVEWVSQREVYFVTVSNPTEEPYEDIFSDLPIPENAVKVKKDDGEYYEFQVGDTTYTATKKWIREIWEGTRIAGKFHVDVQPRPLSITVQDPNDEKLSYFGLAYTFGSFKPVSLVKRMKPFQYLYLIVMHKLKKLVAQDFGKIFPFDITMVDPKVGLEKTLYYLRELGIDIYNPLQNADQPGWSQRGKVTTAIDLGNAQHIVNYLQILALLDQQIGEVAGINRQREGYIAPQEAVTNAQQNATLSSVVTLSTFYAHDKLWERLFTALINLVKQTNTSIYATTVLDDESTLLLTLDSVEPLKDSHIGVFVTSSVKDQSIFETLRQSAMVMFNSKQISAVDFITLMSASSVSELKKQLLESERKMQQQQQELMEQQAQLQQQQLQLEHALEMEKEGLKSETAIRVAEINSFRFQRDQDLNDNQIPDQLEIERLKYDAEYRDRKLDIEEQKLRLEKQKLENERNKSDNK